jgi:hypothetical protein
MALNIRPVVTGGPAAAVASYDYFDIAEGTGTKEFVGFAYATKDEASYALISPSAVNWAKTVFYDTGYTLPWNVGTTLTKGVDIDFDLSPFNTPKTINGTTYFLGAWGLGDTSSAVKTSGQLVVKIKKWDGTTETEIAKASGAFLYINSSFYTSLQEVFKIPIPKTTFKIGDVLRVTGECWYMTASNENKIKLVLWYDPGDTLSGAFKILVPFKLDV